MGVGVGAREVPVQEEMVKEGREGGSKVRNEGEAGRIMEIIER